MPSKPRKSVKAEINKTRSKDPIQMADELKVDPRKTIHEDEKNRYTRELEERKKAKRERDEKKLAKPYIGNKKHIVKRSIVEAEDQKIETEAQIKEELEEEEKELEEDDDDDELVDDE